MVKCAICGIEIERGNAKKPRKYCDVHREIVKRVQWNTKVNKKKYKMYMVSYGHASMTVNQDYMDYMLHNKLLIKGVTIINLRTAAL